MSEEITYKKREPKRIQKTIYIQEKYSVAFDDLVHKQKKSKGKKGPELAEESIYLLLEKYGEDLGSLLP